jgi:hypothetical protein
MFLFVCLEQNKSYQEMTILESKLDVVYKNIFNCMLFYLLMNLILFIFLKVKLNVITLNVVFYSFLSGLLACFVSLFIKLAFNTNDYIKYLDDREASSSSSFLKYFIQAVFVALSFLINSFMWLFYTKSLNLSENTLLSTALNKFSNFICSALFGLFIFEEKINFWRWSIGLIILFIGILILNDENKAKQSKVSDDKRD